MKAGLYLALGITFHTIETVLLPLGSMLPLPGVRLGLANLVGLVVLAMEGPAMALGVTLGRILLGSIFSGTFLSLPFWMGFGGGMAAMGAMIAVRPWVPKRISWMGLSVIGAFCHNMGQLGILYLSLPTVGLVAYLPWMILLSVPSGVLVGVVAVQVIGRLEQSNGKPRGHGEES